MVCYRSWAYIPCIPLLILMALGNYIYYTRKIYQENKWTMMSDKLRFKFHYFFPTHDFGNFCKLLRISLSLSTDGDNNFHIIVKMNLDRYKWTIKQWKHGELSMDTSSIIQLCASSPSLNLCTDYKTFVI